MKTIIFPQHPTEKGIVDPEFAQELSAAQIIGHDVILFDYDKFISTGIIKIKQGSGVAIYRGWMLKPQQYELFYELVQKQGYSLINTPLQYKNCHYYPEVFDKIKQYAAPSAYFHLKDFNEMSFIQIKDFLSQFEDKDVIIKDYVKSEQGTSIFKIETCDPSSFTENVIKFVAARGNLFNEGIVLKEVQPLLKVNGFTNEWRIFVYNNHIISTTYNVNAPTLEKPDTSFLADMIMSIDSNFFTIDLAQREDRSWFILETGDGQVSGLCCNQNELEFYSKL